MRLRSGYRPPCVTPNTRRHQTSETRRSATYHSRETVQTTGASSHGVTPQQLFGWRREARQKAAEASEGPSFVRAIIETPAASPSLAGPVKTEAMSARPHNIELDIEGASVWIWRGADPTMVTSIIGALKARE